MIDETELQAIESRCNAATPGPWRIAHAREDVPALIAALREVQTERDSMHRLAHHTEAERDALRAEERDGDLAFERERAFEATREACEKICKGVSTYDPHDIAGYVCDGIERLTLADIDGNGGTK